MLTKESLEKQLLEKRDERHRLEVTIAETAAQINALQGAIQTLEWIIENYATEQDT